MALYWYWKIRGQKNIILYLCYPGDSQLNKRDETKQY